MPPTMWRIVAAAGGLQIWLILGLLPAISGDLVASVWCGLALLSLLTGLLALHRSPDAAALFLCLVFPVTLIPPFVFGRSTQPLLGATWIQALAGASLALCLLAVVRARRHALVRPPRGRDLARLDGVRPRRAGREARMAALVLGALWLALPARALLDPSLLQGRLAEEDPVRAKAILLLAAWASVTLLAFGAVLPALAARAPSTDAPSARASVWLLPGALLGAAWVGLVLIGA